MTGSQDSLELAGTSTLLTTKSKTSCRRRSPLNLTAPSVPLSRRGSNTQYEFIMHTETESVISSKQKLKAVRSHVMKNYLHQRQHRADVCDPSQAYTPNGRRRSKQRTRHSRSTSIDHSQSPPQHAGPPASCVREIDRAVSKLYFLGTAFQLRLETANENLFTNYEPSNAMSESRCSPSDHIADRARKYLLCVITDILAGSSDPSYATLSAKVDVVTSVKDTLAVCGSDIPPKVIFAVSLLAYGCAVCSDWREAQGHAEALVRLVESCGGAQLLDVELHKTVTWTTYCITAAMGTQPTLPPPFYAETRALPLAFSDDAQLSAWRTTKRFPKNSRFVYDIVVRLHRLSLATSSEWHGKFDEGATSNLHIQAMFEALSIAQEEPWVATQPKGSKRAEMSIMFRIWSASLPLFVWATGRHLRSRLCIDTPWFGHELIISRIQRMLDDAEIACAWPRGKFLEPILVSLYYCLEACEEESLWRPWILQTMRQVAGLLKLESLHEFKKILEFYPATDEYRQIANRTWMEMDCSVNEMSTF